MENNLKVTVDGIFGEGAYDDVAMYVMMQDMMKAYGIDVDRDCCDKLCDCGDCDCCDDEESMTFYDLHLRLVELDEMIRDINFDLEHIITDTSRNILNNVLDMIQDEYDQISKFMKDIVL